MKSKQKFQVAVIVYTYNSDLWKTLDSIRSAVLQTGIRHQIIIGDDGSKKNHREEIEELFRELDFSDYRLSLLEHNQGITENLRQASLLVEAEYIKILSPGDYLAEADVLAKLYAFMKSGNYKVCFGDAVYFRDEGGELHPIKDHMNAPRALYPYDADRRTAQFLDCLLLNDFTLGAAIFTETETYREYNSRLAGHVKYFEDNALRLMIYDGICVRHFPGVIMWYEYGNGISTCHSEYWLKQLKKDYGEANRLMKGTGTGNPFLRFGIRAIYALGNGIWQNRYLISPNLLPQKIRRKYLMQKAPCCMPGNFLKSVVTPEDSRK